MCLYNPSLLGATRPERAHDEDEEDEEKHCHKSDYGDVASVGQGGTVRSLSWNHVSEIQHVAQRPACITAFYLDRAQEEGNYYHQSPTDTAWYHRPVQFRSVYSVLEDRKEKLNV